MAYASNKSELPPSTLGEDRCFQIKYFGHGDIFAAAWQGSIDHSPTVGDGISACFNFAHGSDVVIMASLAGYLRRVGRSPEEVKNICNEAGEEILTDDPDSLRFHHRLDDARNALIAEGVRISRFDIQSPELRCLVTPIPTQPGVVDLVGGTGIYTRPNPIGEESYVFASIKSGERTDDEFADRIGSVADFCVDDVPVMARLACNMALGEYRRDIHAFLTNLYVSEE